MKKIGGNTEVELQINLATENELGEQVAEWTTVHNLIGWLELSTGDSRYTNYNAKIEESTHVLICDYQELDSRIKTHQSRIYRPKTGDYYEITLIDNPQELNYHLEIYLKYTGAQNG